MRLHIDQCRAGITGFPPVGSLAHGINYLPISSCFYNSPETWPESPILTSLLQTRTLRIRIAEARPRLYRLAYTWCHDACLADDLAQEALIKGLKSAHQLKDALVLEAWLFSILNNCWRDHLRRLHPLANIEEIMELPAEDPTPEQHHAESELVGRVRSAVAALPLGQRQAVTLVDLEEMSYSAAAQALGVPVGTVMSRLSRARNALRGLLHETPVSTLEMSHASVHASVHVLTPKSRSGK